jgi:hypothetical protein
MPARPDDTRLPESVHGGTLGMVRGFVRAPSGRPVGLCAIARYPTSMPVHPVPNRGEQSAANGSFQILLPEGTYTLRAFRPTTSDVPVYGEVTGVVVTVGRIVDADITVPEEQE